jgi:hypothetical protein
MVTLESVPFHKQNIDCISTERLQVSEAVENNNNNNNNNIGT